MSEAAPSAPVGTASASSNAPSFRNLGLLLCALAVATVALIVVGNGNPLFAVVPLGVFIFLYVLFKIPLRWPALVMVFAGLTLENPGDIPAEGHWKSPLYPLGQLLLSQLKQTVPIGALVFTGVDVLLVLLTAILIRRRIVGSRVDAAGAVATPRPMVVVTWVCLGGAMWTWAFGLLTGGSFRFSLWQVQRIIYLPFLFLFLQAALPGGKDLKVTAARLLLISAGIKATLAIYIHQTLPKLTYATTHPDSMLFASATVLLILLMLEKPCRKSFWCFALMAPLLIAGMVANNRRLVWVEISLACIFVVSLTRWTRAKKKFVRWALFFLPLMPPYVAAGWNSPTGIFAPVKTIRSVLDSKSDGSTEWRDLENYNLFYTIKDHPITGTGFGHPFEMPVQLPDVTSMYELEPYCPHNSILGLWAYTGFLGFSMIWMIMGVSVYFAGRAARFATEPADRVAALGCLAVFVIYMFHCYGDLGLGTWTSVFLVSMAMVVVAKLSTQVGAWPTRAKAAFRPDASRAILPGQQTQTVRESASL